MIACLPQFECAFDLDQVSPTDRGYATKSQRTLVADLIQEAHDCWDRLDEKQTPDPK